MRVNFEDLTLVMEWGDKENRIRVIALHNSDIEKSSIFKALHPLGISHIDRQRSRRPCTLRTQQAIEAVKARIGGNPIRKQKMMCQEMKISSQSM